MSTGKHDKQKTGRIPEGEFDAIKSAIPSHLLQNATDAEKHIVQSISVLDQRTVLTNQHVTALDEEVGAANQRIGVVEDNVSKLKDESDKVKIGWKLLSAIAVGLAGFIIFIVKLLEFFGGGGK